MTASDTASIERALWALRAYDTTALGTIGPEGPHVAGVFFAPEANGEHLQLVLAVLRGSRKLNHLAADPRVAFMCSPGKPSRWIQGQGLARVEDDEAQRADLFTRLLSHAPDARDFVEQLPVVPVMVSITTLKIVEAAGNPPLQLHLSAS